jgi:cation-transporting ATPase E
MFTIGITGFLLSQMPNTDLIRGNFVENILKRAIPGGLADVFMIATSVVLGTILGLNEADISTGATLMIAVIGFAYIYSIIRPLNGYKSFTLFGCMIGLVLCTAFLPTLFSMSRMEWKAWILYGILGFAAFGMLQLMNYATGKIWGFVKDIHHNRIRKSRKK